MTKARQQTSEIYDLVRKMCIAMDKAVIGTIVFTWIFSIIMAVVLYFFPMELSEASFFVYDEYIYNPRI